MKAYNGFSTWKPLKACISQEWFKEDEIETLAKEANLWRNELAPNSFSNIGVYAVIILSKWTEIRDQKVEFMEKRLFLEPFKGWDKEKAKQSLTWWCAFDDIKHSRAVNIKSATLWNTVNVLSALYMLEMKYL